MTNDPLALFHEWIEGPDDSMIVPLPPSVTVPPPTNWRSVKLPVEFKVIVPLSVTTPAPVPLFIARAWALFTVRLSTESIVRLLIVTEVFSSTLEPLLRTAVNVFPPHYWDSVIPVARHAPVAVPIDPRGGDGPSKSCAAQSSKMEVNARR